jgi:FAD-linked oxidoreductase
MITWHNWSGSVTAQPAKFLRPRTHDELATLVRSASKVRVVGAGHSFMPLCATDGLLLALEQLEGTIDVAPDRKSVWAPAGWSLKDLTHALWELGFSLPNQGDVNPQSLAGAISTGTHGTGAELGSLATFARAFRLMLADGSIVECSPVERPALFEAARLSLGMLGIAVAIRVDVIPALRLEERIERLPIGAALEQFPELAASRRHVEFFVFPYSNHVILKTLHPTDDDTPFQEAGESDEMIFRRCCDTAAMLPALTAPLQHFIMRFVRGSRRVGPAYRIFPSDRTVPFEEMEYEMPRTAGLPTLMMAIEWLRKRRLPVTFPFEFRWVAGDDIWLSPFNRGPGASISMHQYSKMPWQELFAQAEPIFRAAGGRPHWAKRHRLSARDIRTIYPKSEQFCAVRREVDPHGKFTNAHLAELFPL